MRPALSINPLNLICAAVLALAGCASDAGRDPVVEAPARLAHTPPTYPRVSLRLGEEGKLVLRILVLKDGSVGESRVAVSSGFPRLDEAALKAVAQWRYSPATQGGKAVDMWIDCPMTFTIDKSATPAS